MELPPNIESIRQNIFQEAHNSISDWSKFPWHRPDRGALPDADRPNSSQAFCISVWGTFAARNGASVRSAVVDLLGDDCLGAAVAATPGAVPLRLEDVDRGRLNEHPANMGTATNLDALVRFPKLAVVVESKLTETLGSCSQPSSKRCSGIYGPGSDLKTSTGASCRLEVADGRREPRTYWKVMRRLSNNNAYLDGQPCAFAGPTYQVMRVIASAAETGVDEWRAIFAYPPARYHTRSHIDSVVQRLRPEHQSKILHLDYLALAHLLAHSNDPVSCGLAKHMFDRLSYCGLV